jgi:YD repeat-containing protein
VLCKRAEQATSDATGSQGFTAPVVGSPRVWQYSYNEFGQVLSATDPNGHTTTYAYDGQGNLVTITNAAGQATTLSNYDANGRTGRITDANGLVTELTYAPRGWLTSRKVGDELTRYDYDGVGQLTKVTQPDGSTIGYTYDDAHRLTDIADGAGDHIHYTLDAMGNRISEQVSDPNGTLARQTTRVYDALNRLQQVTGGMQ